MATALSGAILCYRAMLAYPAKVHIYHLLWHAQAQETNNNILFLSLHILAFFLQLVSSFLFGLQFLKIECKKNV